MNITTSEIVSAGLTNREALVASTLAEVLVLICEAQENCEHAPEGSISEHWAGKIKTRAEDALKKILGRKEFCRHEKAQLDFVAEICRLHTPSPIGMYPGENDITEYRDYAEDIAGAAQAHLTNVCAGMPVSVVTEMATIFTNALHDREPFSGSLKWSRDWAESASERRADTVIAMRRG